MSVINDAMIMIILAVKRDRQLLIHQIDVLLILTGTIPRSPGGDLYGNSQMTCMYIHL